MKAVFKDLDRNLLFLIFELSPEIVKPLTVYLLKYVDSSSVPSFQFSLV